MSPSSLSPVVANVCNGTATVPSTSGIFSLGRIDPSKNSSCLYPPGSQPPLSSSAKGAPKPLSSSLSMQQSRSAHDNDDDALEMEWSPPRRKSTRSKKSTVIVVGAHHVKKENNYVLKGLTYQFGVHEDESTIKEAAAAVAEAKMQAKSKEVAKAAPVPKPTRTLPEGEQERMFMKQRIDATIQQKKALRMAFFQHHLDTLKPFLDAKIVQQIQGISPVTIVEPPTSYCFLQPDAIQATMRDYQLNGLSWMYSMYQKNVGIILGDEMGLGKTLQTISLVCHLKEQLGVTGPSLIVCPLSVLYSWCDEIQKWAPSLKHIRFHCSAEHDQMDTSDFHKVDMVVTTYEMIKVPGLTRLWSRQHFNLVVLDEGHRIKNAETQIFNAVNKVHAELRIILTGTPLANNLVEMWALLKFLVPDVFTTSQPFAEAFDLTLNRVDPIKLKQANEVLKVFMLRRLKGNVERLMPKKIETKVICPLSNMQIFYYKALLLKDITRITGEAKTNATYLNNLIMQLRKACIHPYMFGALGREDGDLNDLVGTSGKLSVLDKLLCSLYRKGHRVVLFTQFVMVLDILDDYCSMRGWNYCRFDGSTSRAERNFVVNSFNAPGSRSFLFIMSTRSGGVGLNLQTADTCVLFDSDWNPQPDIQAIARIHRIGQTKTVHIYRLVTEGTVEERMIERAEKKLYLDRMVVSDAEKEAFVDNDSENADRLLSTLRFGCNAVFGQGVKRQFLPSAQDIEVLTDRSRTEEFSTDNLKGNADCTALDFDATKAFTSTTNFGGIDFLKIRKEYEKKQRPNSVNQIHDLWKKRQRKNRILMLDGINSGYGLKHVPVLACNNYELQTGEKSVFERELAGRAAVSESKKIKRTFENQDFCQVCGDGGTLVCCSKCPVCVHLACVQLKSAKEFMWCHHHGCTVCGKSRSRAGGFLFPCESCGNCYCEDHLPSGARFLYEGCARMETLGYTLPHGVYVHCSDQCERVAVEEFGWKPPATEGSLRRDPCPPELGVSSYFGGAIDECIEVSGADDPIVPVGSKRRLPSGPTPIDSAHDPDTPQTREVSSRSSDDGSDGSHTGIDLTSHSSETATSVVDLCID